MRKGSEEMPIIRNLRVFHRLKETICGNLLSRKAHHPVIGRVPYSQTSTFPHNRLPLRTHFFSGEGEGGGGI